MLLPLQVSPSKRTAVRTARLGAGGEFTMDKLPRPSEWPEAVQLTLPRSTTGINEYIYALAKRHPDAIRCAWCMRVQPALTLIVVQRRLAPCLAAVA